MNDVKKSTWRGMTRLDFSCEGHDCILIVPDAPEKDAPWIWRCEFFDAFAQVDEAMARLGRYIFYVRLSDRYGCPSAIRDMKAAFDFVTAAFGLARKAQLFGFSRGALYAANFALAYPECVDRVYLDAPVLSILSWPLCEGRENLYPAERAECLVVYGLTGETAMSYRGDPVNRAEKLAALHIPVMIVAGDADRVVPVEENCLLFAERFRAAGGTLTLIMKPGCDHHPHSLDDPAPVVDFLTRR